MRLKWQVAAQDVKEIRETIESRKNLTFVHDRITQNVSGPAPLFSRDKFWWAMMDCLLTTRQRSNEGSPVYRFSRLIPHPLALKECEAREAGDAQVETFIEKTLSDFHGIRFAPTIAKRAGANLVWLKSHWKTVEDESQALASQRSGEPNRDHAKREREAAQFIAQAFEGFGPKQSRNLWQLMGLTRYEIPIDSRVTDWINGHLSVGIESKNLSSISYYEDTLDYLQAASHEAHVLPCVFDAAAFSGGSSD